jgi:Zn-dependent protease with chaperone function
VGYLLLLTEALGLLERRKEYLADLDAVRVAGTDGALETLDTLISLSSVETAMTRAVLGREPDLWGTIGSAMRSLSQQARLHRRTLPPERRARVGDSHPAAQLRVRLVQSWPRHEAAVRRSSPAWDLIDRELAPALPGLAREVADRVKHR